MTHDNIIADYQRYKRQAIKWARVALDNHKAGLPWRDAAQQAREYFNWANLLIK